MAEATAAAANETANVVAQLEDTQQKLDETEEARAGLQSEYTSFRQTAATEKRTLENQLDQTRSTVVDLEATRDGLTRSDLGGDGDGGTLRRRRERTRASN